LPNVLRIPTLLTHKDNLQLLPISHRLLALSFVASCKETFLSYILRDRIILSFRQPFLSFYIYLLLIWLFMFIFIFLCCFLTTERVYCKICEIATFLEVLEFRSIFTVCAHKHLPMCRGTTVLHIHRGPPYTFAQITL
jgi:hypothetical protein